MIVYISLMHSGADPHKRTWTLDVRDEQHGIDLVPALYARHRKMCPNCPGHDYWTLCIARDHRGLPMITSTGEIDHE